MKIFSSIIGLLFITIGNAQSKIVSEEILLMNDSIQLPGTLAYQKDLKQQPLAIFIHGSGGVDRNGNQGPQSQASYIKQLSEALTQKGIAFYRYDKRTSNMANAKFLMKGILFQDIVNDAKQAINKFKDDSRFSSITLVGHSQGSLVSMLVSNADVNKYISLSGPSKSFDTTLVEQVRIQNGDTLANTLGQHFNELKTTGTIKTLDPNFAGLFNPVNQKFFVSYIKYIPTEEIKKVTIPTLILNGTKDIQVFEEDAKALHKAKPNAQLILIENMNHVLKTITKDEDNLKSYSSPDFPLSEELIKVITEFIKK